jgi:hypothetical protein
MLKAGHVDRKNAAPLLLYRPSASTKLFPMPVVSEWYQMIPTDNPGCTPILRNRLI